ncbi:MAG: hypothetical protein KC636_40155, partial [Myxococcales bacterium]|nr:hypothetical protein [Myxococcales bacterium]
ALGRLREAETFFDGAQELARVIPEPETQATSLEWRGRLQEDRGERGAATASYLEAAKVARANDRHEFFERLRSRLVSCPRNGLTPALRREVDDVLGRANA